MCFCFHKNTATSLHSDRMIGWDEAIRWARLKSALRTTLACCVVGVTTLYGPMCLRRLLAYPAFSYVTAILIVSEATLGDALRGCWHVLYATVQVLLVSVPLLWLIRTLLHSPGIAAVAVALVAFAVALPESTHLMSKRIAFGQIVIVYVGASIQGANTQVMMHPVRVASSTALGALASLIALLVPYPRLACTEVRRTCLLYADNASKRFNLYLKAFCAGGGAAPADLISQAASLSTIAEKQLRHIKHREEGLLWERPDIRFLKPNYIKLEKRIGEAELPLRGMEMALTSCFSFPVGIVDEEFRKRLAVIKLEKGKILEKARLFSHSDAPSSPKTTGKSPGKHLHTFTAIPTSHEDLPTLFFMFCIQLLRHDLPVLNKPVKDEIPKSHTKAGPCQWYLGDIWRILRPLKPSGESFVFAVKCSLALGFAVLFGLLYSEENGYWSGLTIAISFVMGRQPTFMMANARAQGTAMGSVYGILCSSIFRKVVDLEFLPLLPWIIFTSFIGHSRMYGQAGGISAVIGALLILGRKNYGQPTEFAIARIAEASIGLICFIGTEFLFEPVRAATLAKVELSSSFRELRDCVEGIVFSSAQTQATALRNFQEKHRQLKSRVTIFGDLIEEAEIEPSFWFTPCPVASYRKMLESFYRAADLLQLVGMEMELLWKLSQNLGFDWKGIQEPIYADLEVVKEKLVSSVECLEEVTSVKSLKELENKLQKRSEKLDLEIGKFSSTATPTCSSMDCRESRTSLASFLHQLHRAVSSIQAHEGDEECKSQIVLCIGSFNFCLSKLIEETILLEDTTKELTQKENPSSRVNLSEISSKASSLG